MVALWIKLLRQALGAAWKPDKVTAVVSAPEALPEVFHGISILRGDRMGFQIRFPSSWLSIPFNETGFWEHVEQEQGITGYSTSIVESVRQVLRPHVGVGTHLTVERAAMICRVKKRKLSMQLAASQSSLASIIDGLNPEHVIEDLVGSQYSLQEITASLGYSDTTAFSRAFKRWTGLTPLECRRQHSSTNSR